ncbi:MAG: CDP-diacylglycerol--glycerol-3-phosphate 3-phosphatidyltransferase [Pirellulales bacterium]|nr:CDP-diacylglycerol--glycerol-3-phosphate 3-phosphatidyltransferase [Pirellulales bacterium]
MSAGTKTKLPATVFNLPNQLTIARLVLSVVLFVLLSYGFYLAGFVLFILAASTDWLDGYFARKYGLVTMLGRILDPFVDKVIICGTFIYLSSAPASGVAAWMSVVVVGRELLITALRSFLEQRGADFSAQFSGKLKMVLQCVAASVSLLALHLHSQGTVPTWLAWLLMVSVWAAVVATVASGVAYVRTAIGLLRA